VACGGDPLDSLPPAELQVEAPAESVAEEPAAEEAVEAEPASGGTVFVIMPEQSEARFVANEILNGAPKTVVGATSVVAGEIVADFADTSAAQVMVVSVDASTLVTDNNFRNRAIRDVILQTGDPANQFVEFVSTSLSGLPASVNPGETYTFQMTGNLTVKGAPNEVTFDASVTPVSETRLEGTASTRLRYEDLGVSILRLPDQVASVEDEVQLEIDFVAEAQ
jgi:polyisoprenoid-binding protein YceI